MKMQVREQEQECSLKRGFSTRLSSFHPSTMSGIQIQSSLILTSSSLYLSIPHSSSSSVSFTFIPLTKIRHVRYTLIPGKKAFFMLIYHPSSSVSSPFYHAEEVQEGGEVRCLYVIIVIMLVVVEEGEEGGEVKHLYIIMLVEVRREVR